MIIQSVLHVDDDKTIGKIVRMVLEKMANWHVDSASTCEEALEVLLNSTPDVILLDIMMPEIDGIATLQKMRSLGLVSTIPVIIMSAKVFQGSFEEYNSMGAAGVIQKPFDPLNLPDQIEEIVDNFFACRESGSSNDNVIGIGYGINLKERNQETYANGSR